MSKKIRLDFGTENGHVGGTQVFMCKGIDLTNASIEKTCFIYGKSTANQCIESFWDNATQAVYSVLDKSLSDFERWWILYYICIR